MSIGVANVNRSPNGTRYTLTRDDDSRIVVGYVEVVGALYNVRTALDEPVPVGSPRYNSSVKAVRSYLNWAERH